MPDKTTPKVKSKEIIQKETAYKKQFNRDNYSRITLYFPKADKAAISLYCKAKNIPVAEFVKNLIYKEIGDTIKRILDINGKEETASLKNITQIIKETEKTDAISNDVLGLDKDSKGQER